MTPAEERQVNLEIVRAKWPKAEIFRGRTGFVSSSLSIGGYGDDFFPWFTRSVDSCLAVIPKDWEVSFERDCSEPFATITFYKGSKDKLQFYYQGKHGSTRAEALALVLVEAIRAGEKL